MINPVDMLHKGIGREVAKTESCGVIKVAFQIGTENMGAFGF